MLSRIALTALFAATALVSGCSDDSDTAAASAHRAVAAGETTRTYRHATGLTFRHPAAWTVQATASGGLSLLPPDLRRVGGQPGEAFTLVGQPADGIRSAADPRVARFVVQAVTGMFPHLRVTAGPSAIAGGGRAGLEVRFAGDHAGTAFRAAAQSTVLADTILIALTLTTDARFAERHAAMQELFASLEMRRDDVAGAQRDARLVGRWHHHEMYHSTDFNSMLVRTLVLAADGSCVETQRMTAGLGGEVSMAGGGGRAPNRGRWHTQGQQLVLNWTDGTTTLVRYVQRGRSMLWQSGGQKKLWERN